jgi:hypothetical protein
MGLLTPAGRSSRAPALKATKSRFHIPCRHGLVKPGDAEKVKIGPSW